MDSVNNKIYQPGSWGRATTGFYINNVSNKTAITASAYYQFGKTATSQQLSAFLLSGVAQYTISKKLNVRAGIDYTSGGSKGTTSNVFDPLYGTPHKFWGLMDYFYAASPFGKNGLADYYIKVKYKLSDKILLSTDFHQFNSAKSIGDNKKNLGQELDIVGFYTLTKQIGIEAGYCHFFTTSLLTSPLVKNVPSAKNGANWAYLMINIKPDFFSK